MQFSCKFTLEGPTPKKEHKIKECWHQALSNLEQNKYFFITPCDFIYQVAHDYHFLQTVCILNLWFLTTRCPLYLFDEAVGGLCCAQVTRQIVRRPWYEAGYLISE